MQNAAILYAGSGADPDTVHITANGNLWPDGDIILQFHVSQHHGAGINENALAHPGCLPLEAANTGSVVMLHGYELVESNSLIQ